MQVERKNKPGPGRVAVTGEDIAVFLSNVIAGAGHRNVGHLHADKTLTEVIAELNGRVPVRIEVLRGCLNVVEKMSNQGKFRHPLRKSYVEFIDELTFENGVREALDIPGCLNRELARVEAK